ncbi:hypothetical protein DL93DRAFT_2085591 [Clavulina sp. PMI_390]|nr:hypothetical protein DL93DRAFT_2085591 [Clavulina sp. PMI_390]
MACSPPFGTASEPNITRNLLHFITIDQASTCKANGFFVPMISSEEEAQNSVYSSLSPLLESIKPGTLDLSSDSPRNVTLPSEAHYLCYQLQETLRGQDIGDMVRILERAQQFGAFESVLALLLEIAPFAGSLSPAELEADWINRKVSAQNRPKNTACPEAEPKPSVSVPGLVGTR